MPVDRAVEIDRFSGRTNEWEFGCLQGGHLSAARGDLLSFTRSHSLIRFYPHNRVTFAVGRLFDAARALLVSGTVRDWQTPLIREKPSIHQADAEPRSTA